MRLKALAVAASLFLLPKNLNEFEVVPNSFPAPAYQTIVGDLDKPFPVRISAGWEKAVFPATRREVLSGTHIWRNMRIEDVDILPEPTRAKVLENMLAKYGRVVTNTAAWSSMTSYDWDQIPQPVRAIAYMNMADHWARHYRLSTKCRLSDDEISGILKAVIAAESYFEHRAENRQKRNIDIGISGSSDYARNAVRKLYKKGRADFSFSDEDYYNPYNASRKAAHWLGLMLDEAKGDVNTAIRAYNVGISSAASGKGTVYENAVKKRLEDYVTDVKSPTLRYLMENSGYTYR